MAEAYFYNSKVAAIFSVQCFDKHPRSIFRLARRLPHAIPLGFSGSHKEPGLPISGTWSDPRQWYKWYRFIEEGETALKLITEIILIGLKISEVSAGEPKRGGIGHWC